MSDVDVEDSQDHEEPLVTEDEPEEEEESPFVRDPVIEGAAHSILGYTVDEVKRKTISVLTRELEKHGHSFDEQEEAVSNSNARNDDERVEKRKPSPKKKDKKDDDDDDAVERLERLKEKYFEREERRSKKTVSFQPVHEPKDKSSSSPTKKDDIETEKLAKLKQLLEAKISFTKQLEKDDDFTRDDLADWNESIERLENKLKKSRQVIEKKIEAWKRKQDKIEEMESYDLLDEELKRIWKRKQDEQWKLLKKFEEK